MVGHLLFIAVFILCCSFDVVNASNAAAKLRRTGSILGNPSRHNSGSNPIISSAPKAFTKEAPPSWGHAEGDETLIAGSVLTEEELQFNAARDLALHSQEQQHVALLTTTNSPTASPSYISTEKLYPNPCINDESELIYVNGELSFVENFKLCISNIADPLNIPTIRNGSQEGVQYVYTNIQLNNLHSIDAIAGQATLDFYLRLYWRDNRFNMSVFWSKCSTTLQKEGFDLTQLVENGEVMFWLPDIRFHDLSAMEALVGTLRVNSSNVFFWSRHVIATFMQPKLEFATYPSDDQYINIRYGSYAFSQTSFKLVFISSAISFNQNFDKSYTFQTNPLWEYQSDLTTYSQYTSPSNFLNVIYRIRVNRISQGIILRLILPIAMLIVVGGFVFWADPGSRVDSTITLLLAVSALYIVILANVPLVGYMTAIDRYVFLMFIVLTIATLIHQTYVTLNEKTDRWPLRIFYIRGLECLGRITIFPAAALLLLFTVDRLTYAVQLIIYFITFPVNGCIMLKEVPGVMEAWGQSTVNLIEKLESDETELKQISSMEMLVYNISKHGSWSKDNKLLLAERELIEKRKQELELEKEREKEKELAEIQEAKESKKKSKKKRKHRRKDKDSDDDDEIDGNGDSRFNSRSLSHDEVAASSAQRATTVPTNQVATSSFWNVGLLGGGGH